jgi:hypothetical protein
MVVDAMIACGIDHDVLFQEQTQTQRFTSDIFGDEFSLCLNITFKELDDFFQKHTAT